MAVKYDKLILTFKNTSSGEQRDVQFLIEDHPLAQKWASLLKGILTSETYLEKNYLLHGWVPGPKSLEYLCAELNSHIEVINRFFATRPQGLHYHIPLHFDPSSVDQPILNLIHHDFEILIGQVWDVSKYFKISPPEVHKSIRQLNNLCHEIEAYLRSRSNLKDGRCSSAIITSIFPRKSLKLTMEEKQRFQLFFNFGDVRLHYAQLGKTHLEAFHAQDEVIHEKNITELRYLTGEFDICLCDDISTENCRHNEEKFYAWINSKNLEHKGPFGFAVVAKLDRTQFKSPVPLEILKELFGYDDVCKISLTQGNVIYSREYGYLWNSPEVDALQSKALSGEPKLSRALRWVVEAVGL